MLKLNLKTIDQECESVKQAKKFLKKANLLNNFFALQHYEDEHDDLFQIAMYLGLQLSAGIINPDDLKQILDFSIELKDSLSELSAKVENGSCS